MYLLINRYVRARSLAHPRPIKNWSKFAIRRKVKWATEMSFAEWFNIISIVNHEINQLIRIDISVI